MMTHTKIRLDFTNNVLPTSKWIDAYRDSSGIVVTKHEEMLKWHVIVKDSRSLRHDKPKDDGGKPFWDDLKKQLISDWIHEKKYYPAKHRKLTLLYSNLGEIWDESISYYLNTIPNRVADAINSIFDLLGIRDYLSHAALVKTLKALGDHAKKFGDLFSEHWIYFVNLEMCWKYGSTYNIDELMEDVIDWFKPKKMTAVTFDQYYSSYADSAREFVTLYWSKPIADPLTWNEFLASGGWGTTGSTDAKIPLVQVQTKDGWKLSKSSKTKNATLVAKPWTDYSTYLTEVHPQLNKVSIKPDEAPNKTRLIVSGDTVNYLLMAYVSTWFESHLSGEVSSLFKSVREMALLWAFSAGEVDNDNTVKTPIDQSHFDHHATAEMIYLSFLTILEICPKDSDLFLAMKMLINNIFDVRSKCVFDTDEKKITVEWRGGVPSGWRWTALIDTMVNFSQFITALSIIKSLGSTDDVAFKLFQGDDVNLHTWGYAGAIRIVRTYALTGLEVNESKFFSDHTRDEFLRRVSRRKFGVSGYPARTIHSLLWKSPNAIRATDRPISEMLENWLVYKRRGATDRVMYDMIEDMCGATKISKKDIKEWVNTPSSLGGGGLMDFQFGGKTWRKITQTRVFPKFKLSSTPRGLTAMASTVNLQLSGKEENDIAKSLIVPQKHYAPIGSDTINEPISKKEYVPLSPGAYFGYETHPLWLRTFPRPLRQVVINRALRDKGGRDAYALLKSYLDPRSWATFDHLKSNASRNVFSDWLLGGFDIKVPKSIRFATDFIAGTVGNASKNILSRCLGMHHITRRTIQRVQLFLELKCIFGYERKDVLLRFGLNPDTVTIAS